MEAFRKAAAEMLKHQWKKTFNPFDRERPRVAKYPVSMTDHVEVVLDGVPHMFRVTFKDIGTVDEFNRTVEAFMEKNPDVPLPPQMVKELQEIHALFKKDMDSGNFVPA